MQLVVLLLAPVALFFCWFLLTRLYDYCFLKSLLKAVSTPIDIEKASEKELHQRIITLGEYLNWQWQRGQKRDPLVQAEVRQIDQELKIRAIGEQVEYYIHQEASRS